MNIFGYNYMHYSKACQSMKKENSVFWQLLFVLLLIVVPIAAWCSCDIALNKYEVLEDISGSKTFSEIQNNAAFKSYKGKLNFGYTQSSYWIKLPIDNECRGRKNFLVPNFRAIDYLDFYLVENDILTDSLKTGFLRPIETRQQPLTRFVFQLPDVIQKNTIVYLRIQKKEGTLRTELHLKDEITLYENIQSEKLVLLFFIGVGVIMFAFAIGYFFLFKMNMFLWYALFVVCGVSHQLANMGLGSMYLWGNWEWFSAISRIAFTPPAILGALMFSRNLLKVQEYCSARINKIHTVLKYILVTVLFVPFLPIPEYPFRFFIYLVFIVVAIITFSYLLYTSYIAVKKKHLPGYLFISGIITMLGILVIIFLLNLGIIKNDFLPEYFHIHASIIMMSFGMFSLLSYTLDINKK